MIEYFTALVIAYNLQGEQIKTVAWFKSQSHCQIVMKEISRSHYTITYMISTAMTSQ